MKVLSDKFQIDPLHIAAAEQKEAQRRLEVQFEKNCRQMVGVKVLHDPKSARLNAMADALKGVRL